MPDDYFIVKAKPCNVSRERFVFLNTVKYKRDLTQEEIADYLTYFFYCSFGYNPDWDSPRTYNEKLNWLKMFYHDPRMHTCADKAMCIHFVQTKLPDAKAHCVTPLAIFHKRGELKLNIDKLPERFMLKSNFGSGAQTIVDKRNLNVDILSEAVAPWLSPKASHYYTFFEYSYKNIRPALICEPLIQFDYKIEFFCFDGKPQLYWIIVNDKTDNMGINFYNMAGERLPVARPAHGNFNYDLRPDYFDELVKASEILSAGFPHVRVDFYAAKETWYFSEMTFYPGGGVTAFTPFEFDIELGKLLKLRKME